tara:strand:+ start:3734 stop:3961 length:228 start_codon:yes stop_codon:yes gene_type:complete
MATNPQDYFDRIFPEQTIDISASQRKIQTSMVVSQDPEKSGILSFLESVEIETVPNDPSYREDQTIRPNREAGGY